MMTLVEMLQQLNDEHVRLTHVLEAVTKERTRIETLLVAFNEATKDGTQGTRGTAAKVAKRGRPVGAKTKAKITKGVKTLARKAKNVGRVMSEETRAKLRRAQKANWAKKKGWAQRQAEEARTQQSQVMSAPATTPEMSEIISEFAPAQAQ